MELREVNRSKRQGERPARKHSVFYFILSKNVSSSIAVANSSYLSPVNV